jgi:nucleotide-binding universal stress UspA family protein
MEPTKTIVVCWDFTPKSQFALDHGIRIAKVLCKDIVIVHVAHRGTTEDQKEKLLNQIEGVAHRVGLENNLRVRCQLLEGNIFRAISSYATESGAELVLMGTHGIRGMQRITGSWALKVIVGSSVPFVVVQKEPAASGKFSNIVFPIDFRAESKEKLLWAIYMGKYFNSKVNIFLYPVKDKLLKKKEDINLNFAVRFLIQNNIEYEIFTAKKQRKFAEQTMDFAKSVNADLIMVVTTKYITFADYMFGASEQRIIANSAGIPVMCINPRASFSNMGEFMYGQT